MRLCVLLVALSTLPSLRAQTIQVNKENRTVAVTATDHAEAPADLAAVTIGFVTFGSDQTQTYADATHISNTIMEAIHAANVPPEAIESKEQSLTAVTAEDKMRFARGIRFRCSQSWQVTVPAASAATILHVAILSGANESGYIQWKLKNTETLEAAAATNALTHARQIAERLAKGLGAKLGPLVYASDQVPRGPFGYASLETQNSSVSSRVENLKPLAISPEKISTSATVYAVFAIE